MPSTAQVAVSGAAFHFDKLYTYKIPENLQMDIKLGSMVLVPFGKGSRAIIGVVLQLSDTIPNIKGIKNIFDVAKQDVCLSAELLSLVYFLREQTFCTYYDAVKAIIPYGALYKAIIKNGIPTLQKQLTQTTDRVYKVLQIPDKLTEKQQKVIDVLGADVLAEDVILTKCNITKAVLDRMCEKSILQRLIVDKVLDIYQQNQKLQQVVLSQSQQNVYKKLSKMVANQSHETVLLHGVTSSGKTLVFIKLLEDVLGQGKKALVLVPEIGLTPQMVKRLKSVFGKRVAVQHSALSNTERLLQWQQIQQGKADIVVGTRSAVFAPLENIGLIIIDEEQEHTYKSEQSPRFCAHNIAKMRASTNRAILLLASATPSVESYYQAQTGKYKLVELTERYNNISLPEVEIVDMRENLLLGNIGVLSQRLRDEISFNLNNNQQTILLLNRRGYQTVAICKSCTEVIKCDSCSVPMVYHKSGDKLLCHHCGHTIIPAPQNCPQCQGEIKYTGYGTQKIEEELGKEFSCARILRMDLDSTGRKNSHEKMLSDFANGAYDILIGTQMVAKGLDFEKVSLVGVVGIDSLLLGQGYRSFENVFSLVTQVVGRSGRSEYAKGRAIIQTLNPQHPVLNTAAKQDYNDFYQDEIQFRKLGLYPPFCNICMACFTGETEVQVKNAACEFSRMLSGNITEYNTNNPNSAIPVRILGPMPFGILMVNNKYRYKLTLKCKNNIAFRNILSQTQTVFLKSEMFGKVNVYFDFNSDSDV